MRKRERERERERPMGSCPRAFLDLGPFGVYGIQGIQGFHGISEAFLKSTSTEAAGPCISKATWSPAPSTLNPKPSYRIGVVVYHNMQVYDLQGDFLANSVTPP